MSIEKRQYIRFSLDIPVIRYNRYGEAVETMLHQISIGGCLAEWDETVLVGDEFRMLIELPNQNFLPLACKAMYRFADNGIGVKFLDITQFEQELVSRIISKNLASQGVPMQVNPFGTPRTYAAPKRPEPRPIDYVFRPDEVLEDILQLDD